MGFFFRLAAAQEVEQVYWSEGRRFDPWLPLFCMPNIPGLDINPKLLSDATIGLWMLVSKHLKS